MKKSIIALAVLASMAAQADNTTLYGSVRMAYTYNDGGEGSSSSSFGDAGSRLGVKGSTDLGNGLSSFYKYENRLASSAVTGYDEVEDELEMGHFAKTNKLYVGLKGGFGSVSFGKQNLPVDSLGNYSDPFNALTPDGRGPAVTSSDQSLVYTTPDYNGFSFGVGVEADGLGGKHNHMDHVNVAAKYDANGFFAGLGYSRDADDLETDVVTLGLGYGNDQFEIGLLADQYDDGNDTTWARLSGLYNVTPMDAIYLGFSSTFTDVDGADDDWQAAAGYQHKFSDRTRTWAEYSFADNSEENQLSLGLRTDF